MTKISPARAAAFSILREVEEGRAHADDLLRTHRVSRMSPIDRNLTTALVLGVLRWQIRLDQQFRPLLAKPNAKLDREELLSLRLGAFQITQMERIPAHAAIAESVEMVKHSGHHFAARMVNAVLRKLVATQAPGAEQSEENGLRAKDADQQNTSEAPTPETPAALAFAYAHPAWLVERWISHFGLDATKNICAHGQQQAVLNLRLDTPEAEEELRDAGIELTPGHMLTAARTIAAGDVTAAASLKSEHARLQDEGSQLIAELTACNASNRDSKKQKVGDLCAAPGGKTLALAALLPKAKITACESSPQRFLAIEKRLALLSPRVQCRQLDAVTLDATEEFHLILVDAPCSGTGTLGRNPEIRYRIQPTDLARQAERQQAILTAALNALQPGGRLIYSTCSLEPEENQQVVDAVLATQPNARQLSLDATLNTLQKEGRLLPEAALKLTAALTPAGALQLLPGSLPTDGFFAALIEKTL
jgi:16S rRNA (cytosine967-C5)-methyltransferase